MNKTVNRAGRKKLAKVTEMKTQDPEIIGAGGIPKRCFVCGSNLTKGTVSVTNPDRHQHCAPINTANYTTATLICALEHELVTARQALNSAEQQARILQYERGEFDRVNDELNEIALFIRNNYRGAIESGAHARFGNSLAKCVIHYLQAGRTPGFKEGVLHVAEALRTYEARSVEQEPHGMADALHVIRTEILKEAASL